MESIYISTLTTKKGSRTHFCINLAGLLSYFESLFTKSKVVQKSASMKYTTRPLSCPLYQLLRTFGIMNC